MSMVIDCSVVLAWCLADESNRTADAAVQSVVENGAVVPGIWWYEVRNVLVVNERRSRLSRADTEAILQDLRDLGITLDHEHDEPALLELARQQRLSAYDAAYLEVAQRREFPLCTLDGRLQRAAAAVGITAWQATQEAPCCDPPCPDA
jgi:predicted nucleic acid-binding protein